MGESLLALSLSGKGREAYPHEACIDRAYYLSVDRELIMGVGFPIMAFQD